jgi:hypothetical protein
VVYVLSGSGSFFVQKEASMIVLPVSIGVRISMRTAEWLTERAAQEDCSVSAMARRVLERAAQQELAPAKDGRDGE